MILCDKLSEENINCRFLLSNENETVEIYWNGEDMIGEDEITDKSLYRAFTEDENIIEHFLELLEKGVFECDSYKMEL